MFIQINNKRQYGDIIFKLKCDKCETIFDRNKKTRNRLLKKQIYEKKDYCFKCCVGINNSRIEYRTSMSKTIRKLHRDNPEIGRKISRILKEKKANVGDRNGMKQLVARQKVSMARKKMFENPVLREEASKRSRDAWANGKFNGVRVGQCKWFEYIAKNGVVYKVQGTWELAFIEWLDINNLTFDSHRGRLKYILNDINKSYYPDFWVNKWNAYVDIKCKHFYNHDKFNAIKKCNPDVKIIVLFGMDLIKMGVKLNANSIRCIKNQEKRISWKSL